jgi:hypothetical protein
MSAELEYKPDWEETKQRFIAWWNREDFGRCGLAVRAPRKGVAFAKRATIPPVYGLRSADEPMDEAAPRYPDAIEDRWLDLDYIRRSNEYRMRRTYYGGEALPVWNAGYPGWDAIWTFLGCPIELAEETGWSRPILHAPRLSDHDCRELVIPPDNRWWQFAERVHRFAVEESRGKSLPGIQGIGGCGDTLAALRGTERLLFDVMDCPDSVREFDQYLMKQWFDVYEKFFQITREGAEGSTAWTNLWSPGRYYLPHNDFSCMISPEQFRRIFLPSLEMQTRYLDHSIYHLDGEMAYMHVDALCELPRLTGLQILTSTGKSVLQYLDVLKKVQRAGKNLWFILKPEEVHDALDNLSSRGLFIDTECASEAEARSLLANAEKWSKVRA